MKKIKVIIDSDPGIDDLLALAVALKSPRLDILAISTVFGNVSLENTTLNTELLLDVFDKKIEIIKGSTKPIFYDKKNDSVVHGIDGLANLRDKYRVGLKVNNKAYAGLNKFYEIIKNSNEKITIIAIGPLTNIAKLLVFDSEIKEKIESIYIMGGGDRKGNVNEFAEFNFYSDSYAAKIVIDSGIPIVISTLDTTSTVYITKDELSKFKEKTIGQNLIKESVEFYTDIVAYLHDVVTIMSLTHPEYFTFKEVSMNVIVGNEITDGMSYILRKNIEDKTIKIAETNKRKEIIEYITSIVNKY